MFRHLEGPRSIGRGLFFCPSAALNFHLTFCGLLLALLLFDSRGANSMRQCLILFLLMFTTACEGTFESSEFSGHDFSDSQASTAGANWATSIQGYEPIDGIVSNGRGNMDPIPIDAAQTAKVQAYLLTLAPALSTLSGPEVYDRLCVGCHGDVGAGIDTKGMQLRYDDDAFSAYWVRAGRGTNAFDSPMPAYPASMISNQQLDEMFTWIRSEPHPTDGEGLFNQYCANCHGADGRGGSSGESIRGSGAFTGVVRQGKNRADGYDRRRSYMSAWTSAQISDAEIQLISAYAAGL
jgi:mono/diheme cytochrome c family protein